MDPQNRATGSRFLGYSRLARPRSMRTCRVRSLKERGGGNQPAPGLKQGTEFFELLAAVAGQFLQDAGTTGEAECETSCDRSKKQPSASAKHGTSFRKRKYQGEPSFLCQGARGSAIKRKKSGADVGTSDDMSQASLDNMMSMDFEAKAATPSPTSASGSSSPRKSVKLSIKSFTVPELLIDMPESATVASLKKAVLDATMNLLGGGLRIRVFLHGKRVPDEEATLAQVGLSQNGKAGSLGFMLEPASSSSSEDALLALSHAASQPGSWHPPLSVDADGSWVVEGHDKIEDGIIEADARLSVAVGDRQGHVEAKWTGTTHLVAVEGSKNKLTRSEAAGGVISVRTQSEDKKESDSSSIVQHRDHCPLSESDQGAIVQHPTLGGDNAQGLAMVSLRQKQLSLEGTKRRIRRPFTIAEVEALVYAVEKLGLGRWRDVKLWAFDQAKHRTYVDLKDKWKTLVHTARIAPHQRRGEPVPQELLERVIRAQNYWTARQAKQQAELDF